MTKSFVSMDTKVCPVCGKHHEVGILLDKNMRDSLEKETVTGQELCPEHLELYEDDYLALIEISNTEKEGGEGDTLKSHEAIRTGNVFHVPYDYFNKVFDRNVTKETFMVFIDQGVGEVFTDLMNEQSSAPEETLH